MNFLQLYHPVNKSDVNNNNNNNNNNSNNNNTMFSDIFFKYVCQCRPRLAHSMTYFIYYQLGINSTSSDKL